MGSPRTILYFTGTRADFGLMQSVLSTLDQSPDFSVEVVATGMHLMPQFGNTIDQVEAAGFPVHRLEAVFSQDSKASMAAFLGSVIQQGTALVEQIQPDMILLLGDRAEMLAGASIGAYLYIPTIHIGGGDETSTIDNAVRHAITRLSHLHFPATEASRERLISSGEAASRCFNAGAPALDAILNIDFHADETFFERLGLQFELPLQVVILHPESLHEDLAASHMEMVLEAVMAPDTETVVIYPNADAGGRQMIEVIESKRSQANFHIFPSLAYLDYLHLLFHADLLVGNSSSGILEAPSFQLPTVNLGDRQKGREKAANIVDAPFEVDALQAALAKANSDAFREIASGAVNFYDAGGCGQQILATLQSIAWNEDWLQK